MNLIKLSCYNESLTLNELDKHQRVIKTFATEIDSKFINSTDYINKSMIIQQQKKYKQIVSICSSVLYAGDICYQLQNINFRQLFNFTDDKAAIGYKPDLAYAYYNKGLVLQKLHKHKEVISAFDSSIQHALELYEAYTNKASIFTELGNYAKSIQEYDIAIQYIYFYKSIALFKLGKTKEVMQALQKGKSLENI